MQLQICTHRISMGMLSQQAGYTVVRFFCQEVKVLCVGSAARVPFTPDKARRYA